MNIVREIRNQGHDQLVAICGGGTSITFESLFTSVDAISSRLSELPCFGNGTIPRVGVLFPNGSDYITVALAVLNAGGCFVPIPEELTEAERKSLIATTALHCLVKADEAGEASFEILQDCKPGFPVDQFEALNPAFIRFSSGTTGDSKGVVLSHESLLSRILSANQGLKLSPGDKVLWTLPMAHHFAVTIILYLYHGVTTVLETSNRPHLLYQAARESRTNLLYGSPLHFAQLAQCQEAAPLPHLRMAISTASALSGEVAEAFQKRFQLPLTQALGIIEIGLPILNTIQASEIPTALGHALPAYEARTAADGELLIRGPGMFDAYLSPWQPRGEITTDNWFATGDLVEISDDGTIIMHGRKKSVINVGGMKVFPEEIEEILNTHPAIAKSRVFPERHPTLGSYPAAQLVLQSGEKLPNPAEIRKHCLGKLSAYKIPMLVEAVNSIALTASGKVKGSRKNEGVPYKRGDHWCWTGWLHTRVPPCLSRDETCRV